MVRGCGTKCCGGGRWGEAYSNEAGVGSGDVVLRGAKEAVRLPSPWLILQLLCMQVSAVHSVQGTQG